MYMAYSPNPRKYMFVQPMQQQSAHKIALIYFLQNQIYNSSHK